MSEMEPDARDFLKRVSLTILAGLVWLLTNVTAGIFGRWLFFENSPTTGNIIFYTWLTGSLFALVVICIRLWKSRFH